MNSGSKRAHILLVEDDRDIRESVAEILQDQGYGVSEAADGVQALRLLEGALRPDLILLDLMMPNMNGFEFRQEQLKNTAHAKIPVAVLTADGNALVKADKIGAAAVVRKPLKIQTLLAVVEKLLRLEHAHG